MTFSDTWEDLQNIDADTFSRIGTAPIVARGILILAACAIVIGAAYHFVITPQFDRFTALEAQEIELREAFDKEQSKAANRAAYVDQLEEMKKTFNVMLRQLPNRIDIESLLVDLSQTSVSTGLEVQNFRPESEISREFYAEYPIRISVSGQYHQFGSFVSGLAALPRIVTLSDIDITSVMPENMEEDSDPSNRSKPKGPKILKMNLVATTYRYLEEEEQEQEDEEEE